MGIVLGIYAGTTITSYLLFGIANAALNKKLDREGYIDLEKEKSNIEKLRDFIQIGIMFAIPLLNIVMASIIFFSDKAYDDILSSGIENGHIRRKTEEELALEKEMKEIKTKKKSKTDETATIKTETHIKAYSEMTNEEKLEFLEREKAFLLSQNSNNTTKSYNDRGAYRK